MLGKSRLCTSEKEGCVKVRKTGGNSEQSCEPVGAQEEICKRESNLDIATKLGYGSMGLLNNRYTESDPKISDQSSER